MLLELRKLPRWAICTPPKCGTLSLEATLRHRSNTAIQVQGRHGFKRPAIKFLTRMLIVRNPWDRWWSMYWFMYHRSGHLHEEALKGPDVFAEAWAAGIRSGKDHHWYFSLSQVARVFVPHDVFKLEEDGVAKICKTLTDRYDHVLPAPSHTNVNRRKGDEVYSRQTQELILEHWVKPDCERFHYDSPNDLLH